MPFDIDGGKETLNPSRKFDWDKEGKEWVKLRLPTDEDSRQSFLKAGVEEKVEWRTVDKKTRQQQRVTYFDPTEAQKALFDEEMWDISISEWFLVKPNGEEIPCTRENKVVMMRYCPAFSARVNQELEKMQEDIKGYVEASEKN